MSVLRCPICEKKFESEKSEAMPFCSDRCRRIDLGRWLNESYGVPIERRDPEDSDDEAGWSPRDE
jgi:endogenous inhibitor of DNA gyrase (YacG/DUF329 family)